MQLISVKAGISMKRVCFAGVAYIMDQAAKVRLYEALEQIISQERDVEFWYAGCYDAFEILALEYILAIKESYLDCKVEIVAVMDPLKYACPAQEDIPKETIEAQGFPQGVVVRVEFAPRLEGKSEKYENRFVTHSRKVDRWVMDQCDTLLVFNYDSIPGPITNMVRKIQKKGNMAVIPIYNPERLQNIEDNLLTLSEREQIIVQGLRSGRTFQSLGEELGVTLNRIQQITNRAGRRLYYGPKRRSLK